MTYPSQTYTKCTVWGYVKDTYAESITSKQPIIVELNVKNVKYGDYAVIDGLSRKVIPTNGQFEIDLLDTVNMSTDDADQDIYYIFNISGTIYRKYVPEESSANFWELETPDEIDE